MQKCYKNMSCLPFTQIAPILIFYIIIVQLNYQNQEVNIDSILFTDIQTFVKFHQLSTSVLFFGLRSTPESYVTFSYLMFLLSSNLGYLYLYYNLYYSLSLNLLLSCFFMIKIG